LTGVVHKGRRLSLEPTTIDVLRAHRGVLSLALIRLIIAPVTVAFGGAAPVHAGDGSPRLVRVAARALGGRPGATACAGEDRLQIAAVAWRRAASAGVSIRRRSQRRGVSSCRRPGRGRAIAPPHRLPGTGCRCSAEAHTIRQRQRRIVRIMPVRAAAGLTAVGSRASRRAGHSWARAIRTGACNVTKHCRYRHAPGCGGY
jgi:hypothetical protein